VPREEYLYDEVESTRRAVTTYVQARSNTLIKVKLQVSPSLFTQYSVKFTLRIDGEDIRRLVLDRES
jgi:hypothetical protein